MRPGQDIDRLLARADRLDTVGLMILAAEPSAPAELHVARRRALEMIRRRGLEADLERAEGRIAAWSFADVPRAASSQAWGVPGQDLVADLRSHAAPALLDAVVATMLGPALDEATRGLLVAQWREATDPAAGGSSPA